MAALPVSKLYRFAPTRELRADYDALVPTTVKARKHAKELREYLKRREQENVTGIEDYPVCLPSVDCPSDVTCGEEDSDMPWLNRQQEPLLRTIAVLRRALYLAGKEKKEAENGLKMLVQSARESPSVTASILSHHIPEAARLEEATSCGVITCARSDCSKRALPYSRFCHQHVSSDQDQVLYGSCTASDATSRPCGNTVFDFLLHQSLCSKHVTKAALDSPIQQQKRRIIVTNRTTKTKGKVQKGKKAKAVTTATTKLVLSKPSPVAPSLTTLPALSSTSSWSSGESDGEAPEAKRPKIEKPPSPKVCTAAAADADRLPSLTPETLDMSLTTAMPLPALILPPPLPDIGKFMDDSSSDDS